MIKSLLSHPLTRGLSVDDPSTTVLRKQILQEKAFLRKIYEEWYGALAKSLDVSSNLILEIGSGAGFLCEYIPELINADILLLPWLSLVLDGGRLPIQDEALDAVVMVNVLHHMPDAEAFFKEATRSIKTNGQLAMIEPWVTPWSKFIYTTMHHEPCDPSVVDWFLNSSGPLSSANGALPWIVFERDRKKFIRKFPEWEITQIQPMMPFTYLLSGGVSLRSFMPGWSYKFWSRFEASLDPCLDKWAMFAKIILTKRS